MEEWHGILVVDDEADVAARFRRGARRGTYVLHFVGSADEALELPADAIEPTLIAVVPDINMPGMDGLELLRGQTAVAGSSGHDGDHLWRQAGE